MKLTSGRSSRDNRPKPEQNSTPQRPAKRTTPKSSAEILADLSPETRATYSLPTEVVQNQLKTSVQTGTQQRPVRRPEQNPTQRPASAVTVKKPAQRSAEPGMPRRPAREETQKKSKRSKSERKDMGRRAVLIIFLIIFLSVAAAGGWYYWWTSHATFDYSLQPVVILEGHSFSPDDFLDYTHGTGVMTVALQNPRFIPAAGLIHVPVTLTYGMRSLDTTAVLYVLEPIDQITIELGQEGPSLDPMAFIANAEITGGVPFDVRFTETPLPLEEYPVGEFNMHLALNGEPFVVTLTVVDTTPPDATAVSVTINIGDPVRPEDFIAEASDPSGIASISFVTEPDVLSHREQIVEIIVEDVFGNTRLINSSLTILLNQDPPTIEGVPEAIESMVGNPIIFLQGITAYDDFGRPLPREEHIGVNSEGVNQHEEGTYAALIWAEDLTGLRTQIEVTVHVISIDPEYVNQRVDAILFGTGGQPGILRDGMTQREQVRAIFNWIRENMRTDTDTRGGPQSVYEGAYRAFRDRRGNCYIFYSIGDVMLTRAGIPNMRIMRITGPGIGTMHNWSLINPDNLGWHHFDSMWVTSALNINNRMDFFSSTTAAEFARLHEPRHGGPHYYTYDTDLYPEICAGCEHCN